MKTNSLRARNGTAVAAAKGGRTTAARTTSSTNAKSTPVPALLEIKSILVPTDFSAPSKKALDYAVPFAERFGAKLTLLHVVDPLATPDFANSFPLMMENDKVIAACKAQLQSLVKQTAIDPKLVEKTLVRQGRSFHEIADAARTLKADLIIISTHGYTGLKHALLGSTAERVVRHAPCPVLVVREREREFVAN
jgi:universal stress protein A